MWVGGRRFATNIAVLQDIECKFIVDCTPSVEGSEDEGPFDGLWPTGSQPPEVVSWSILFRHHKGTEMSSVMKKAREAWMAGSSILFFDNMGDRRCIVASVVFLREAVGQYSELKWLSTLSPRRTLNSVLVEICDRYGEGTLMDFEPKNFPDDVILMIMQDRSTSWHHFIREYPVAARFYGPQPHLCNDPHEDMRLHRKYTMPSPYVSDDEHDAAEVFSRHLRVNQGTYEGPGLQHVPDDSHAVNYVEHKGFIVAAPDVGNAGQRYSPRDFTGVAPSFNPLPAPGSAKRKRDCGAPSGSDRGPLEPHISPFEFAAVHSLVPAEVPPPRCQQRWSGESSERLPRYDRLAVPG